MRDYLSHEVRNVVVLGHSGVGKTAVMESMLYFTKASDRFGVTSEGSSLIDYCLLYTSIIGIKEKRRYNGEKERDDQIWQRGCKPGEHGYQMFG